MIYNENAVAAAAQAFMSQRMEFQMHPGVYRLMLFEVQGRRNFGRGRSRAAMRRRKRRMALLAPKRPSALI